MPWCGVDPSPMRPHPRCCTPAPPSPRPGWKPCRLWPPPSRPWVCPTAFAPAGALVPCLVLATAALSRLAMHATIAVSRAGEQGKGFAVVATEVKALARRTAKATQESGKQISAMQETTGACADAGHPIGQVVDELAGSARTVAAGPATEDG